MESRTAPDPNDKILMILCHLSLLIGVGFVLPLVLFLVKREESPLLADHAKEVLNFHISLLIYAICCIPLVLVLIGIPMLLGLALGGLMISIVAAIKASEGVLYRYPLTIRFIV